MMTDLKRIESEFEKHGGVLKTAELNDLGLSSRQIKKIVDDGFISRIKRGFYELTDDIVREEVIISRLFPEAIIFLESALIKYGYTDRIPTALQIAVNRYSKTTKEKPRGQPLWKMWWKTNRVHSFYDLFLGLKPMAFLSFHIF